MKGNKYIRNIKLHQLGIDVDIQYIEIYNFLEDNLNGLKEFKSDKYTYSLFYGKDKDKDNIILEWYKYKEQELKNDYLRVHYDKIWSVFEMKYSIQYTVIQTLLIWYISGELNLKPTTIKSRFYIVY